VKTINIFPRTVTSNNCRDYDSVVTKNKNLTAAVYYYLYSKPITLLRAPLTTIGSHRTCQPTLLPPWYVHDLWNVVRTPYVRAVDVQCVVGGLYIKVRLNDKGSVLSSPAFLKFRMNNNMTVARN